MTKQTLTFPEWSQITEKLLTDSGFVWRGAVMSSHYKRGLSPLEAFESEVKAIRSKQAQEKP